MKKFILFSFLSLAICGLLISQTSGQKTGADKVTVQITRDGKIISDTTLQLKEGQDPEAVKKVIAHVLEGDLQVITKKEGYQKMVWVTSEDDEHMWHAEDIDVRLDSINEEEEMVMVYKGDHPGKIHKEIIVKKGTGDKEIEKTVIVESGDEIEISEGEEGASKVIIIKEKGDKESDAHERTIKVFVEDNGDVEILDDKDLKLIKEDDADNIDVYIIKKDDGTKVVKKVKKVEVTVEEENESNDKTVKPPAEPTPKPGMKK